MKRRRKKIIIIIVSIILVSNLPVLNTVLLQTIDSKHFKYSNNNAAFTSIEYFDIFQPWISKDTERGFIATNRPEQYNMEIFRLYKINPFCFWRWRYYLLASSKFSYKSWEEIEPNRIPSLIQKIYGSIFKCQ